MGTQASCLLLDGTRGRMGRMVMGQEDKGTVLWGTMEQWDGTQCPVEQPRTTHHAPRTTHHAPRTTHYALRTTHYALRTQFHLRIKI
jgi:hypothetical protein